MYEHCIHATQHPAYLNIEQSKFVTVDIYHNEANDSICIHCLGQESVADIVPPKLIILLIQLQACSE